MSEKISEKYHWKILLKDIKKKISEKYQKNMT